MGAKRQQTRAQVSDILALQRDIRQRMRENTKEFAAACAARDFGRMARVMDDTLTMIRYAAWLRQQYGYRVARLQLQPVPVLSSRRQDISGMRRARMVTRKESWR